MTSKYINSTCGRKFVTGNGFSDPDFLLDANISRVNQRLTYFGVKIARRQSGRRP